MKSNFDLKSFLPAQLAVLSRLTQAMLASALATCDMTVAHWRIFVVLVQQGPSTLNQIVDFTHLPQSTLSRAVARLEKRGLVSVERGNEDRRRVTIEITAAGRTLFERAVAVVDEHCKAALRLDEHELKSFGKTVAYLIRTLSETK